MNRLTSRVGGVRVWQYGAIAVIVALAYTAWKRTKTTAAPAPVSAHPFVIVETPQAVTSYNVPVTRTSVPLSSTVTPSS